MRRIHQEDRRPGLGHAHAVADRHAAIEKGADQRLGERCSAAAPVAHAREVGRGEGGMQADRLIDRRHAEEDRELARGDQVEHDPAIELGDDARGGAGD
jgi:hypothetical protein